MDESDGRDVEATDADVGDALADDDGSDDKRGDDETSRTRWVVQWSEPFGESQPKRVVDTEADAEAVVEAWKRRYEPVEGEPGQYRVELGAAVYFTKMEVPYGPLPTDPGAGEDDRGE